MAETSEATARTHCAYCGLEIENKSEPNMGGPFRDNWVHIPGGYTICYPQHAADSPRATLAERSGVAYRPDCPACRREDSY